MKIVAYHLGIILRLTEPYLELGFVKASNYFIVLKPYLIFFTEISLKITRNYMHSTLTKADHILYTFVMYIILRHILQTLRK